MHLPANIRISLKQQTIHTVNALIAQQTDQKPAKGHLTHLKASLENSEKQYLETLIVQTQGDINEACLISGLSRSGLYARLKKYGIQRPT
jgi:two-component system NtrC family response regulator